MQTHLDALKAKHETLDNQILTAQQHPGTDTLDIAKLKKKKLALKEKISAIETSH